jgi:hypothetical protein
VSLGWDDVSVSGGRGVFGGGEGGWCCHKHTALKSVNIW